jgi:mono/diheme cytochrome c family protein
MARFYVLIAGVISLALSPSAVYAETTAPTFAKDIAQILNNRCVACHRPGEVAPMSLTSFDEVRPWARAIKAKVVSREMPPWHAEGEPGRWRNDRRLSQAEIDKIVAWVDAGAPRGNDADLPPAPQFAEGWNHPNRTPPDVIIEAPEMHVQAEGETPWLFAYVKVPFQTETWVSAGQVVPGNRPVVHHVAVTPATLPADVVLDAEGRVLNGRPSQSGGLGPNNRGFTVQWEPGGEEAVTYGPGVAGRIAGTHIQFNLHYQPRGKPTTDRSRLGLWLYKGTVTHEITRGDLGDEVYLAEGKELLGQYTAMVTQDVRASGSVSTVPNIPPFAENWRLTALRPVREETTLHYYFPHMHVRGRSMKSTIIYPDGREEVLINVPKYDFNWQTVYELAKPIKVPAGSVIRVDAAWDNSLKNKYNPAPEKEVFWGEQSWDEMFSPPAQGVIALKTPVTIPSTRQKQP